MEGIFELKRTSEAGTKTGFAVIQKKELLGADDDLVYYGKVEGDIVQQNVRINFVKRDGHRYPASAGSVWLVGISSLEGQIDATGEKVVLQLIGPLKQGE